MLSVACIVGTRPEAIKMAPVIRALKAHGEIKCNVVATAQHRALMDDVLSLFGIVPDIDFDIMREGQRLAEVTSRCLSALDMYFSQANPDAVLAQGDTTSVMASAMASFYNKIPFGHVEAGLRSGKRSIPFPEEINRILTGHMAQWHFVPTSGSRNNLLKEGITADRIFVTGNTVIDALLETVASDDEMDPPFEFGRKVVLVTAHRRESFGEAHRRICVAIKQLADTFFDVTFLYPVHPNPAVHKTAHKLLGNHPRISLCQPLGYREFVSAMRRSYLILTDSGGIQEEAPALGVPVLVLRDVTERPEAIECGAARLVGTETQVIVEEAGRLLTNATAHRQMSVTASPYGDGKAAKRIVSQVIESLGGRVHGSGWY